MEDQDNNATPPETGEANAAPQESASETIHIVLSHGGVQVGLELPAGTDLGHIRSLDTELDEVGAPSSYTLGVNGVGQDDSRTLQDGDIVSFRPVAGNKG